MMRRGFLGALLGAPVAAKSAIESGVADFGGLTSQSNVYHYDAEGPSEEWIAHDRLADKLHDAIFAKREGHVHVSEDIKAMKSWSPAFKRYAAMQDERKSRTMHDSITEAMRDENPITRAAKLARIAARIGVKT
ncbi:hypothetical protein [Mameliella alba]|uniref:Uncharacterized protein n=1 Tax=Mameliella alba TaxID=561184 RepID=A0A0B3SKN7_9RHOB|nr:hypothetical protein [Mameliella alba]KHQ51114.1 hypothetical protein OA50_04485 [Mameliella alba]